MATSQLTGPALQALQDGNLAGTWTLDSSKSQVTLRSKSMWGLAPVKGVFRQVTGQSVVTQDGQVTATLTVDAASIDTKNKKRDDHLRSADFFEVDKYPDITFRLDSLKSAGQGVTVTGQLTVHGQARPLSFGATVSSFDRAEVWLDAEVKVNRADFGLSWNQMGMAAMDNTITVHAAFTRQ